MRLLWLQIKLTLQTHLNTSKPEDSKIWNSDQNKQWALKKAIDERISASNISNI